MDYKPHEQWDERNFHFQTKDTHPNIPFGRNNQYKETMVDGVVYSIVLVFLVATVLWVI